ncbi:hypothetical protein JL475_33035 [Streptomyces sp. M2CJ-2]|uniref:hypothetical protein n=1 Tax=Streptomyces sp. M2CJ-2 TaxID=2803948 RepID=UPI001926A159|nr:hypothetical protein [Streptomyces sp. M2CJ-2]MBL3670710.1 hypothetical protein [Streptomyces sp. M2CJ-2]
MFRSEYADVPPVELPIHDAVLARAAEFGSTAALTDGTTLMYEQADRFHRRVAPYKRVRHVTFLDAVPRAASGKILRRELRAAHEEPS